MRILVSLSFIVIAVTAMLYPGLDTPFDIPDPIAHIVTFLLLGYGLFTLNASSRPVTLLLLFALAVFLETGQFLVPSRTPELVDVACNILGAVAAAFATSEQHKKSA